ncbi:MAG TPA: 3-isopropylmalate dehydratase small subunit [Burkholderiales bacterium]|nr:3-isopropylmalate dehydratase small subunit [Burkholderiales bacterium]
MEQFVRLKALAAPLLRDNVNTDVMIPSLEITSPSREGFGEKLFASWRYGPGRVPNPDFVLNRAPFDRAQILIAGENFGCGSSREMAVWAIRQFGFRCVIAPSFGAIFEASCYRNGVLPVVLPKADVEALGRAAESGTLELEVDLESCTVTAPGDRTLRFEVGKPEREMMLAGLDAIGVTLKHRDAILEFQKRDRSARPWIWSI